MRKFAVMVWGFMFFVPGFGVASETATVYKDPGCGCCNEYVAYLRQQGFDVTAVNTPDIAQIKRRHGVPPALEGCHTVVVGGYVVEGHVPAGVLNRLLAERPDIKGIALPGMPLGSPGMGGQKNQPFVIYGFSEKGQQVYATE